MRLRSVIRVIDSHIFVDNTPHIEKKTGKAVHAVPIQTNARILPVPKPLNIICILICKIKSACVADIAVNHRDFLMISVIKGHAHHIAVNRIKNTHLNPTAFEVPAKCLRVDAQRAKVIKQ